MYAVITQNFAFNLFTAAFGFLFLALFGDFYNDYWDYDEDIRNKRKDKFTTSGFLAKEQVKDISYILAAAGIITLWFINLLIFVLGLYYIALLIAYSHPSIRLKGSIKGYMTLASFFFLLPLSLIFTLNTTSLLFAALFGLFFFSQYTYILCQKDSTDTRDNKNLYLSHGWKRSTKVTALFGALSSITLLLISFVNPYFIFIWLLNLFAKMLNISKILRMTVTRKQRGRIVLLEFVTPYMFLGVGFV